jgi:flagellin
MREIVVQAADGSNSASDVALLNTEFKALAQETDRLVDTTSYNGKKLLNGDAGGVAGSGDSTVTFQIGANATQTLKVDFADFGLAAGGAGTTTSTWEGSDARVESLRQLGAGESLAFIGTKDDGSAFTLTIDAGEIDTQTGRTDGFATVTLAEVVDALNYEFMANDAGLGDDGTTTLSAGISDSGQLVFTDAESDDVDRVGGTVDSVSSPTTGAQTLSQSGANPMRTDLSVYKDVGMGGSYNTTLEQLDKAIEGIASQRATFGASMNRLEYAVDNLHSSSLATSVARGRIEDTNYAAETARLAKQQILEQVGTALLAQANMDAKSVLKLLSAN